MEHDENEHCWLAEDKSVQVRYVRVAYLMAIVDNTVQEEECDKTRKDGQENMELKDWRGQTATEKYRHIYAATVI